MQENNNPESKLNSKKTHDEFVGDISRIACHYKKVNSSFESKNKEMLLEVSFICYSKEECERSMDYDNYIIEVDFLENELDSSQVKPLIFFSGEKFSTFLQELTGSKIHFSLKEKIETSQNELNEYRRIKYSQEKRELKKEEKETLTASLKTIKWVGNIK